MNPTRHSHHLFISFLLLLLIMGSTAQAQVSSSVQQPLKESSLASTINQQIADSKKNSADKLYLQLDRANYASGDTLWFSAYLFDAAFLRKSTKSNVVYVELSDEQNVVQVRKLVLMSNGLGHGCIPLLKRDFPDGGYTIRAYTNWQRNFDESGIFKKQIFVGLPASDKWLISLGTAIKNNTAQLDMRLSDRDKKPVVNQQVLLGVRQGTAILRRDKPQITDPDGKVELTVAVRDKPDPVYASLHKGSYDDVHAPVYKFPISYNRPEKIDMQFMPEGGNLIAGISTVVGFKAISEDGKGADVSGSIVNASTGEVITTFRSLYKGMGNFTFSPKNNESYKAIVDLPNGDKKEYNLPQVKTMGTTLSVINPTDQDSIIIKVRATPDKSGTYTLFGHSRGMICYAARVVFNGTSPPKILKAPKSAFASGIVKFWLLNNQQQTVNERLVYNDNKDNLSIKVSPNKTAYTPQDSIALTVEVKDKDGNPVQGAFSISVINSVANISDPDNPSLLSQVLLNADLKGYMETPDYYFTGNREKELDNLLLTQGWTSYTQQNQSLPSETITYTAEPDIAISGRSTNALNKPIAGNNLQLISLNPFFSIDTLSNQNGEFTFRGLPPSDSLMYVRAKNKRGKITSTNIELNRREWPTFSANRPQIPWYFNTDTIRLKLNETLLKNQEQQEKLSGIGKTLKEVEIVDKKIIPGSHNLNGPGVADQVIDEHDIAKQQPMTLLELLKKTVDGFTTKGIGLKTTYYIKGASIQTEIPDPTKPPNPLCPQPKSGFIVDGIAVLSIFRSPPGPGDRSPNRSDIYRLLNSITSDDIKGIEVMSEKFTANYEQEFLMPCSISGPAQFIEITTKSGRGPFFKRQPDYLLFKPIASALQKDFYRPRYTVKNPAAAAFDNRVTIHWEPQIITGKNGKATLSFYAAGQPATYTIITEGSDMNGSVGSVVQKLNVTPQNQN